MTAIPDGTIAVVAAAMLSVSVGMGVPRWSAMLIARRIGRSVSPWTRPGADMPIGRDESLLRTVSAAVVLVSGLIVAGAAVPLNLAVEFHHAASTRFFWTNGLRWALEFATGLVACGPPLGAIGCAVTCVLHHGERGGRWSPASLAWVLLGTGTGIGLSDAVGAAGIPPAIMFLFASVPLLATAINGARDADRPPRRTREPGVRPNKLDYAGPDAMPPASVRATFHLAGAVVLTWWIWHRGRSTGAVDTFDITPLLILVTAAAAGGGAAAVRSNRRGPIAFSFACVLAGAVNIVFMTLLERQRIAPRVSSIWSSLILPCVAAFVAAEVAARSIAESTSPFGVRMSGIVGLLSASLRIWTGAALAYAIVGSENCPPWACAGLLGVAFICVGAAAMYGEVRPMASCAPRNG
ncbi:MAG: hypothetical protein HOP29_05820 [Phycisphaerales bacterium]|nr:hypothetical protein [Phycisphaerales bacterium]